MNRAPRWLAIIGLLLVLCAANYTILQRQQVVDDGQPLLLQLRPVDPRSLMQGDYMELRYADALFPANVIRKTLSPRGAFIVTVDENNVAAYSHIDQGAALAANEKRLKYKQVDESGQIRIGAESFFFEEGQAGKFEPARFGVLHVDAAGNSVLVGLADENHQLIE
ncbi:MAG: GDYXXLXY domain-containing protein [Woeseia sp.]|nr:GDYXXLXY domain-containing protein [Woeseia sp.]MBT8097808.1 GDYXXLXY domain-containing protein [Woeseia sp.]NNE59698.1 GDYXXLXY domain-containing protein [Woeseia sp.]NNL54233.1 GDYXXLXY domain-containing protein [Woeseia sp.]